MVSEPKAWSFHCWGKPFHRVESTLRSSEASGLCILQAAGRSRSTPWHSRRSISISPRSAQFEHKSIRQFYRFSQIYSTRRLNRSVQSRSAPSIHHRFGATIQAINGSEWDSLRQCQFPVVLQIRFALVHAAAQASSDRRFKSDFIFLPSIAWVIAKAWRSIFLFFLQRRSVK